MKKKTLEKNLSNMVKIHSKNHHLWQPSPKTTQKKVSETDYDRMAAWLLRATLKAQTILWRGEKIFYWQPNQLGYEHGSAVYSNIITLQTAK